MSDFFYWTLNLKLKGVYYGSSKEGTNERARWISNNAAEEEAEAEEHRAKAEAAEKVVRLQAEAEKNNAERSEDYEKYLKEEIKEAVSNCYQSGEKVVRYKKMTLTDINVLEQMGLGDILKDVGDTERVNITFEFIEDTTAYMKKGRNL